MQGFWYTSFCVIGKHWISWFLVSNKLTDDRTNFLVYRSVGVNTEELAVIYSKKKEVDSTKEAMDLLKKAATLVGKKLNHVRKSVEGEQTVTPATAIQNYIDPVSQIEFFQHYGVPLPKYLETLTTAEATDPESNTKGEPTEDQEDESVQQHINPRLLEQLLSGDDSAIFTGVALNPFVE
jgi:phage-related holin